VSSLHYSIHRNLHTDFNIFEENKLKARSYFIPFSSAEKLHESDYKNERYRSDRVTMLSGAWDFSYFDHLHKIPEDLDTDALSFDEVTVPSTWQRTGYDQIAYINTRYPFPKKPPHIPEDVAVGIYRKTVTLQKSARKVLTFLGVAGALALHINGKYVGYSEGSHNTAEFDITEFVAEGTNEILAVNYKWSNGTYLECQDMFRENGIFRDVYIVSSGENAISDFCFRPKKNKDGTYDLQIRVSGTFGENAKLHIAAKSADSALFSCDLLPQTETTVPSLTVREWTAETPNIYEVILSLTDGSAECEAVRTHIGFRDIHIDGEVFLFNGQPIKMLGVNHHDTHMTKGYAVSLDDLEKDIRLMKAYNCNTVRTSHYPPDPAFLTMCDLYGLYVVDEADIETHGFYSVPGTYRPGRLSNNPKWIPHYLDRVVRMYERDKNHPSVTMWSLGNESGGYKCQDACYDFLKKENPEVPVHYEGVIRSRRWAYDVVSRMYGRPDLMRKILRGTAGKKYKGKPFFQCEYAHAMGNGPGGLEEYMQLFYASKQFLGGCIWEWADHSVYDENAQYKWTYGGDHNEPIHDGNFCVDGLFYPNREPSSGALEMKACYRPIRAKYLGDGQVELCNLRYFKDSADISVFYRILENGTEVENGALDLLLQPQEQKTVKIDSLHLQKADKDIFINLEYRDKHSGDLLATEQLTVSTAKDRSVQPTENCAEILNTANEIRVPFADGEAIFDKRKGLVRYTKDGIEYLNQNPLDGLSGFVPHIYRGRLDNDQYLMVFWNVLGLECARTKFAGCKIKTDKNGTYIRTAYNFITRGIFVLAKAYVDYRISADGEMTVHAALQKVCPLTAQLPRFGVHLELPKSVEKVTYYGRGPAENYADFKEHAPVGIYETTVTEMAHKYIKPQDSGNRGDVQFGVLRDENGRGFRFTAANKDLNFNANHFTLNQLIKAKHIEDLPDTDTTFVALDGFMRGTGSASCGPAPAKEYLIPFGYTKPLEYTFTVKPLP